MEEHGEHEHKEHKEHQVKSGSSDTFWKITTVALIVILAVVAFKGSFFGTTGGAVVPPSLGGAGAPTPTPRVDMEALLDDDPVLGEDDAPVTIVEFSDYQCPFCGRFYSDTLQQLKAKYVETGKVKIVFRDFPLSFHPEAEPAAIAANCAGEQGKFWEMHDKIFENQQALSSASYKQWAQQLRLDVTKWETCTKDPAQQQEIRNDMRDGGMAGVQGTPAFFVNGQLISGAQPYQVFEQVIEAELN